MRKVIAQAQTRRHRTGRLTFVPASASAAAVGHGDRAIGADERAFRELREQLGVRDRALGDEHAAAGARAVLLEREARELLLALDAAGRVQRGRVVERERRLRRLVQERDDLRGLWGVSARARGVRLYVCRPAFLREDMCSGECAASHRRTQSRSFLSFTCASGSWRRAYVWYCGRE